MAKEPTIGYNSATEYTYATRPLGCRHNDRCVLAKVNPLGSGRVCRMANRSRALDGEKGFKGRLFVSTDYSPRFGSAAEG